MKIKALAFKTNPDRGYVVCAHYLEEPDTGHALVEIFKDSHLLRSFKFPAYKIWNIAAHFSDIVDSEIENDTLGYEMAASTGLEFLAPAGAAMQQEPPK